MPQDSINTAKAINPRNTKNKEMEELREELIDFMADSGFEGFTESHVISETVDNYLKRKKPKTNRSETPD